MSMRQISALVTGASGSIGSAIARSLHDTLGAQVFVTSRDMDRAASTAQSIGANAVGLCCDMSSAESIEACVANVSQHTNGKLHVLVNAGAINKDNLLLRTTSQNIAEVINTNLVGSITLAKAVTKLMVRQRSGSIIQIGSVVASVGNSGQCVYGASKAGLVGFTKSYAKEYGRRGIRANVIEPGFIDVGMTEHMSPEARDLALSSISLGHFGTANDVARMAVFLADEEQSGYVTGQVFRVDGGVS